MRARAEVIAESCDGRVAYPLLRSDPPLLLRPTHSGLTLQAGAAGPIGGDHLELEIHVRPGTQLDVTTTAAMVVLPGPEPSRLDVSIIVAAGASLNWIPEPLVSVTDSHHIQHLKVSAATDSSIHLSEMLVLGRSGECPGELESSLRVSYDGSVTLHQTTHLGDPADVAVWAGPAITAGHKIVAGELTIGPHVVAGPPASLSTAAARGSRNPIHERGSFSQVIAYDAPAARSCLEQLRTQGRARQ
jgi:urease accessory protein